MLLPFSFYTVEQRHKALAAFLCLGLGGTVLVALGFEYIGGYIPCKLCLEERIPYYIGAPLMAVAAFLAGRFTPVFIRLLFALVLLVMLYNFGLGVYHAGAEWQFWPGPTDCATSTAVVIEDVTSLLGNLNAAMPASCSEASLYILGLSMAGWNGVASLFFAVIAAIGVFMRRPKLA